MTWSSRVSSGSSSDAALTSGFHLAFWIGAGLVTAAIAVITLVVRAARLWEAA